MKNIVETKAYVVDLLESYRRRSKQIELLHYELSHPTDISENEMIGALAMAHGESGGTGGHISDKTLYIALNYHQRTENANQGTRAEIASQLVELESQQTCLTETAIRRLIRSGTVPSVRVGRKYLVTVEALEAYLSGDIQAPTKAQSLKVWKIE